MTIKVDMTDEEKKVLLKAADLLDDLIGVADNYCLEEITLISEDGYEEYFQFNAEYDFLPSVVNILRRFSRDEIIMKEDDHEA